MHPQRKKQLSAALKNPLSVREQYVVERDAVGEIGNQRNCRGWSRIVKSGRNVLVFCTARSLWQPTTRPRRKIRFLVSSRSFTDTFQTFLRLSSPNTLWHTFAPNSNFIWRLISLGLEEHKALPLCVQLPERKRRFSHTRCSGDGRTGRSGNLVEGEAKEMGSGDSHVTKEMTELPRDLRATT